MSVLPQDETGKAEHGYSYDFDMPEVAIYVDNGAGGVKLWDGSADFLGDVEVDTDALEAICERIAVATEIMDDWDDSDRAAVTVKETGSVLDPTNSSATPLNSGIAFTGTATDCLGYVGVAVSVFTDQNSAADGKSVQFSSDGTNWDFAHGHTVSANTPHTLVLPVTARYFRIVYTNGGTNQGVFRLQTILLPVMLAQHQERIDGDLDDDTIAGVNKAVIVGETTGGGGGYVNVKVNPSGSLSIDVEDLEGLVASTPVAATNEEFDLSYTGDDLTQIDMTVEGTVWRRTLTYTDGDLTNVSVWVEQ